MISLVRKIPYILSFCFLLSLLSGCYYDKADIVYPAATNCDTLLVKYSTTVLPVLNNSCYSCHSGTAASGGGISLDNFAVLKNMATNGRLVGTISHAIGFSAMPKNGSKLPDCEILKIKAWVNAGALNN